MDFIPHLFLFKPPLKIILWYAMCKNDAHINSLVYSPVYLLACIPTRLYMSVIVTVNETLQTKAYCKKVKCGVKSIVHFWN